MMKSFDVSRIVLTPVTVTYLEMHHPKEFPSLMANTSFDLLSKPVDVNEYREYYYGVGERYFWLDRMVMADEDLLKKINASNVDIFIFKMNNKAAGYIEFLKEENFIELLYFGLLPGFIGKGLGKYFLQWVIAKAWSYRPQWVQLNTCTLDHPNALRTYKRAGFTEVKKEIQQRRVLT